MLVEISLQNNPIEDAVQIKRTVVNKKEILLLNLRRTPLALKTRVAEELFQGDQECLSLLGHYRSDVLYRNKRVYNRIK
jgi:hypothetical protein